MAAGEQQQERGREGAYFAQAWLESTTRVNAPWIVYEAPQMTTLTLLNGKHESWDVAGYFENDKKNQFYAEIKNYTSDGQGPKYREYLADCYSATAKMIKDGLDRECEFMWITWHPFAMGAWTKLCDEAMIQEAVKEYPEKLGEDYYDPEIGKLLAERLWLIVLSERQEELMMKREYLGHIRSFITRGP
ncbi:hypothetical protein EES45_24760 [Streptomyces sp. ADI97-07]|uniref:hypothetical protein n=1 Tax=Streptomyces sp. ADI97-07 TaxID=1522762 RepID=UPI000F558C5A|nr:hypothetical protein [Streptomyces sp. ADI97-07]RPK75702.1 hypothetical protein EES45_24760 [Streptomyces sp. ADI97-07]